MQKSEQLKKSPFLLSGKAPIYKIVLTAVMTAMAVVVKSILPISIPLFGGGLKVGLPGIFTAFPALLLGPLWGGASSALCDILSFLVNPSGGYQPLLTLTAFVGGCVKGLVFYLIVRYGYIFKKNISKIIIAVLLIAIGTFGVVTQICVTGDGVTSGYIASAGEVPDKQFTEGVKYSAPTNFILNLAQYSFDSYTITEIDSDVKTITLPAYALTEMSKIQIEKDLGEGKATENELKEQYRLKVTKTADNLFSDCKDLTDVYIPMTYTDYGFSATAFEGIEENVTIHTSNEKIISYAQEHNIKVVQADVSEGTIFISDTENQSGEFETASFTLESGFKSTVAEYTNILTVGLYIFSLGGLIILVLSYAVTRKSKPSVIPAGAIFAAMIIGGLAAAVPNVYILKYMVYDWSQKSTLILMIPSVIEELCVRCIQAYIVWILFNALNKAIFKLKLPETNEIEK